MLENRYLYYTRGLTLGLYFKDYLDRFLGVKFKVNEDDYYKLFTSSTFTAFTIGS